jgi:alanine dehydrogenase
MSGIVARTAMHGFVNVATKYILLMAELGVEKAMAENPAIESAVNLFCGELRHLPRWN